MKTIPTKRRQPARERARRWLACLLADGPLTVELIRRQAQTSGIAWRTVQRAAQGAVEARKIGFRPGHWVWRKSAAPDRKGRQQSKRCPVCGHERGGGQ